MGRIIYHTTPGRQNRYIYIYNNICRVQFRKIRLLPYAYPSPCRPEIRHSVSLSVPNTWHLFFLSKFFWNTSVRSSFGSSSVYRVHGFRHEQRCYNDKIQLNIRSEHHNNWSIYPLAVVCARIVHWKYNTKPISFENGDDRGRGNSEGLIGIKNFF